MSKENEVYTTEKHGNLVPEYTDPNNTAQASSINTDDAVINSQNTTPELNTSTSPTKSATGSGLDAALGTEYSWNTKAEERAKLDYESDVLESKANYLTNRQELESQGQQMQNQVAMQEYSQNQSNEKAGWTGGYVLDTERQMAFLKQTIQSQMYGQMELQKYGYDTSLAAARLAYDTNKYDLALEYYNTALSRAVSEAEITGYYVSPEVSEHLNQFSIASKRISEGTGTERDQQIVDAVNKWFESNGISKQGVETLVHQEFIGTLKATAQSMANFQENSDLLKIDLNSFGEVDEEGNLVYSEGYDKVNTVHFDKMSNEDIIAYANRGELAKQQVMGYLDGLIEQDIQRYLDTVKKTEGSGDSAKTTYDISDESFRNYINRNSLSTINSILSNSQGALSDYALNTTLDKYSISCNIENNQLALKINGKNESESATTKDQLYDYKLNPTTNAYEKVGYNIENITKVREDIKATYGHDTEEKVIDLYGSQSMWGKDIEQADINDSEKKGEAGKYIDQIITEAKNGTLPIGSIIQFNYGFVQETDNAHNYVYLGNGKFIKAKDQHWGRFTYIPKGYKSNWEWGDETIRKK